MRRSRYGVSADSDGNVVMGDPNSPDVKVTSRILEKMAVADVDAQDSAMTVAQILGGIVVHTSVTLAGTVTTPTAAAIIAGCELTENGQCIKCIYINDGAFVLTLAGGTGVTIADAGQTLAADESALLIFRRASATTVVVYTVGA